MSPSTGDDATDDAARLAANADRHRSAWKATLEDMQATADEREAAGWEVLTLAAGNTAPEPPDSGASDRFGLTHVIPDNKAERFVEAYEGRSYPRYEVYRTTVDGRVFLVTELLDPDSETAISIAGSYRLRDAHALIAAVREAGETYTHVQTLDATYLGSFQHSTPEKFFPHYEDFEAYFGSSDDG